MEILGVRYSERVDKLHEELRRLAKEDVVYDNRLEDLPYWTSGGQYHTGERPPRISLKEGASDETVAHEILHGVLHHTGYPRCADLGEYWECATRAGWAVLLSALHIVIDRRMASLGYDVEQIKVGGAETHLAEIARLRESAETQGDKHWFCILIAAEVARYNVEPALPNGTTRRFLSEAAEHFPPSLRLAEDFGAATLQMDLGSPRSVRTAIWSMLDTVERNFGPSQDTLANLRRKVVVKPFHVRRPQMGRPASQAIALEYRRDVRTSHPRVRHLIWVISREDKTPLWMASCEDDQGFEAAFEDLKRRSKGRLSRFLSHYGIEFWQVS